LVKKTCWSATEAKWEDKLILPEVNIARIPGDEQLIKLLKKRAIPFQSICEINVSHRNDRYGNLIYSAIFHYSALIILLHSSGQI
jgi:hypothetical protein